LADEVIAKFVNTCQFKDGGHF